MKRYIIFSLLTLSVWMWAGQASAVNVYHNSESDTDLAIFGRLEAGVYNQEASEDTEDAAIHGNARLGINAKTKLATNIHALAFVEWEIAAETSQNHKFDTRYAYTGFDFNQYGTLVLGQGDTAQYLTVGTVDVFELWGAEANEYWTLGGRQEGQVMYSAAVGGYTLTASWQSSLKDAGTYLNHDTYEQVDLDIGHGYALALGYNWDEGILNTASFTMGYDTYHFQHNPLGDRYVYNMAISYGVLNDGFYSALLYSKTKFAKEDHHSTGFDWVGGYRFENGLGFMLGAGHNGYHFDETITSYLMTQLSYNFTENVNVYGEARFGLGRLDFPEPDTKQHTKYAINLQYNF